MTDPSLIEKKILKSEEYINDVLKEDLKKTEVLLNKYNGEISEYIQLQSYIKHVQENNLKTGFKTQVDIGCSFYMQANVKDPSTILINIGLDHYIEFSLDDAMKFLNNRVEVLNKKVKECREQSSIAKAHIKLMLLYIGEMQNLIKVE